MMKMAEIEKMKNEVFEIYKESEKIYLEKCSKLSDLLKLFNIEYFDYYSQYDNKTYLKYRIYNNNYIYMSSNLNDEVNVSIVTELMAEENIKVKPFDWIFRRAKAILEFLENYEKVYNTMYEDLYHALEQSNEKLKHEYEKVKEKINYE